MTENAQGIAAIAGRTIASETGATLLVVGGLASAFGAASCCALPLLVGSLGLAGAWLGGLALLAGPYRPALLAVAVVGLVAGGGLLFWHRRTAATCAPGAACSHSVRTTLTTGALCVGQF
jgi:mercuric ion transport protein